MAKAPGNFIPNRRFRRDYNEMFKVDPSLANFFLLICELADENGQVETTACEMEALLNARFNHPDEYALNGDV